MASGCFRNNAAAEQKAIREMTRGASMAGGQTAGSVAVMAVRNALTRGIEVRVWRDRGRRDCWAAGGRILDADMSHSILARCRGITADTAQRVFGHGMTLRRCTGAWVAASRELFVRRGVLFCTRREPRDGIPPGIHDRLMPKRLRVASLPEDFARVLESENLFCNLRALVPFTRWFDPIFEAAPCTQIFLAGVSVDFPESPEPGEPASDWLAPEGLLVESQESRTELDFMTYGCLRTLSDFDSVEALSAEYASGS